MGKATNYYRECLRIFENLYATHPTFSLGRHIATALSDYGDIWGLTNKELLFALRKYEAEIELNHNMHTSHKDFVDKVVKDAANLDELLTDDNILDEYE